MKMLVSGATTTVERFKGHPHLGRFYAPHCGHKMNTFEGWTWAADNGAFTGFNPDKFMKMLDRIAPAPNPPLWVAAPDVLEDPAATLDLFDKWEPIIRSFGLKVALVGQGGLEKLAVPWDRMDALFLGKPVEWKIGPEARYLVQEARRRGLWAHMGMVNSRPRVHVAASFGCDSFDGSGFSMAPDKNIPKGLQWIAEALNSLKTSSDTSEKIQNGKTSRTPPDAT